jgi:NADH dehydrogenase [ubiquinone] 1 alpha subcomplex assembly factor 5
MVKAAPEDRWLIRRMADEVLDRLDAVRRRFSRALIVGHDFGDLAESLQAQGMEVVTVDPGLQAARAGGGAQCDEDRLTFGEAEFDLIIALGTLDTVNDLPGALVLIRRVLRPDGLFIGAMIGAGSLPALRAGVAAGGARAVARFHPAIDVRSAGDLLGRAGFAMPVAENDDVSVVYRDPQRLFTDLRANGCSNVLAQRFPLRRGELAKIIAALPRDDEGRIKEQFSLLYLTGWRPPERDVAQAA